MELHALVMSAAAVKAAASTVCRRRAQASWRIMPLNVRDQADQHQVMAVAWWPIGAGARS
ncbi:hypothetical protein MM1S1540310_4005 [Mycobacteroides abscessus subsp. bolletii 1S-154-0310]|nr:hypothetical protein MM1S1510930_4449 [Mycobacteroides abscessus subsp. bolletii 1S-151-0930]EIU70709.1 hypothetical protein MM1S1520914_4657 [Mycobacteroides abscessus subsp. bolletii 1S-152-0914]EIU71201.1 hypothetical protein MM1S1530915_4001 [Mycobacteroides abscessus subsp. bolletii 1S-153-0915]EIU79582.1 hypothetical protein MM1S1540310_4005 [Mycobacteroides abscessus subsp. bolletii 1S-154-0310]PVA65300.1 hypothetical protein DDJ87_16300 [Mycobacteroides abscessus]